MRSTPEHQASVAVWKYYPPVLFALGTFGNVMAMLVLRRLNMTTRRSAMPVYLTALAMSDTCLLYTGLLRHWLLHVFQLDVRVLHPVVCKVHTWLVYSLIILSAWLLSFMTMDRAVSVWRPHHVSLWCTRTKAVSVVISIAVVSLLINCHLLYGVDIVVRMEDDYGFGNGTARSHCDVHNDGYLAFFDLVWSWVDLTLASLLPFALLLLGNCLILWKVTLSVRAARYLGSTNPNDVSQRQRKTSSMTVTLVALSIIFFLTTSPICVFNVIEHYVSNGVETDVRTDARLSLTWAVVNMLMYTNSAINFYLYCLSGAKFRQELKGYLCRFDTTLWSPSKNPEALTLTNPPTNLHPDTPQDSLCEHRHVDQNHHNHLEGDRTACLSRNCLAHCDGDHVKVAGPASAEFHHRVLLSVHHPYYHSTSSEF